MSSFSEMSIEERNEYYNDQQELYEQLNDTIASLDPTNPQYNLAMELLTTQRDDIEAELEEMYNA
jgi:hypothetical protein